MKSKVPPPSDLTQRLRDARRCSATAKSTGQRCQYPSKRGWNVCRLHGAGVPSGEAHPYFKHVRWLTECVEQWKETHVDISYELWHTTS